MYVKIATHFRPFELAVSVLNCDKFETICATYKVKHFPTFRLYFDGKEIPLEVNNLSYKALVALVEEQTPNQAANLRQLPQLEEFLDKAKNSRTIVGSLVFVNPQYDTPFELKMISFKIQPHFIVGEIRGPNERLHKALNLDGKACLVMYCGGDRLAFERFDGDVTDMKAVLKFVAKFQSAGKCKELLRKADDINKLKKRAAQESLRLSETDLLRKKVSELRSILEGLGKRTFTGLLEKADFVREILKHQKTRREF